MPNLTICADEAVLRRLRIEAATNDLSVSRFVGQVLADKFRQDDQYQDAMSSLFSRQPYLQLAGASAPSRNDIYDRPVMR